MTLIDASDPTMHVVVMVKSPDGTISIAPAAAPAAPQALLADRAVLVFNVPVRDAVNLGALVALLLR